MTAQLNVSRLMRLNVPRRRHGLDKRRRLRHPQVNNALQMGPTATQRNGRLTRVLVLVIRLHILDLQVVEAELGPRHL